MQLLNWSDLDISVIQRNGPFAKLVSANSDLDQAWTEPKMDCSYKTMTQDLKNEEWYDCVGFGHRLKHDFGLEKEIRTRVSWMSSRKMFKILNWLDWSFPDTDCRNTVSACKLHAETAYLDRSSWTISWNKLSRFDMRSRICDLEPVIWIKEGLILPCVDRFSQLRPLESFLHTDNPAQLPEMILPIICLLRLWKNAYNVSLAIIQFYFIIFWRQGVPTLLFFIWF